VMVLWMAAHRKEREAAQGMRAVMGD